MIGGSLRSSNHFLKVSPYLREGISCGGERTERASYKAQNVGSDTDMGIGIRGGLATTNRAGVCGRPPTHRPLLAVREDGGVYSPSLRSRAVRLPPTPCRVCLGLLSSINSLTSGKQNGERVCDTPCQPRDTHKTRAYTATTSNVIHASEVRQRARYIKMSMTVSVRERAL